MPHIDPLPRADLPEFEDEFAMIEQINGYVRPQGWERGKHTT